MCNSTIRAIAIDGPSGAGKSTVAKLVAKELSFQYIDTGAMYRAVTLKALNMKVNPQDEKAVTLLAEACDIQLIAKGNGYSVLLDSEDVSAAIRNVEVTKNVSLVCSYAGVRSGMVNQQRKMAEAQGVVMDGRDIGTNVLPRALLKIFLTASPQERGRRRYNEWQAKGISDMSLTQVIEDLKRRDYMDSHREVNPLKQAEDSILLNSDGLNISQTVSVIIGFWKEKLNVL